MTVYVLWWQFYDEVEVWGVYSSIEKAEKQIPDDDIKDYECKGFSIEEFKLDDYAW